MSHWQSAAEFAEEVDHQLDELVAMTRRDTAAKTDAEITGLERARDLLREVLNTGPRRAASPADPVCSRCLRRQSRHGAGGRDAECPDGFVPRADGPAPGEKT